MASVSQPAFSLKEHCSDVVVPNTLPREMNDMKSGDDKLSALAIEEKPSHTCPPKPQHECKSDTNDPEWEYIYEDGDKFEVYPDGKHEMTRREWKEYIRQVNESDGYDVKLFPEVEAYGLIQPLNVVKESMPELEPRACLALKKYNTEKGTKLLYKDVKKAMLQFMTGFYFFITFEVVDSDDENRVKVFQAQVRTNFKPGGDEVLDVRPKPTAHA